MDKKNNNFEINQIINESHSDSINQVIYISNHNLISCSQDYTIKIWELNNNNIYQVKTCLKHNERVCSILLLENLNIFILLKQIEVKFAIIKIQNYYLVLKILNVVVGIF